MTSYYWIFWGPRCNTILLLLGLSVSFPDDFFFPLGLEIGIRAARMMLWS